MAFIRVIYIKGGQSMKKFGVKDQFGYAFGDMGGSFVNLYVDAFFLTFCTYVLGVSPYFMGTLFLIARIFDAVTDVIMGSIPDRWRIGKSGDKFKPYIKIARFPLAASVLFAFADVSSFSSMIIHVWVVTAYLFYGLAYTAVSIPYGSLAAVITQDSVERTKLSRARSIGGMIAGIFAMSLVPLFVFDSAGNIVPKAFFNVAIVFSILSLFAYTGLLLLTNERIKKEKNEAQNYQFKEVLKAIGKNRPLLGVMLASIGSLLYITASNQLGAHLFKEYYGVPQALSIHLIGSVVIMLLLFPIIPKLVGRYGKKNLIVSTAFFSLVSGLFLLLIPIPNVYLFIGLSAIANFGLSLFLIVVWAVVTDCLDYNEYITGKRYDGTMYSIYTFSRKVGSALASSIAGYGLGLIGFVSGAAVQSEQVQENVRYLFTAIPVVSALLILIGIGLIYNLNGPKTEEMYAALNNKREVS
jgi:glycoside/pentoside/hexuronide:cation symporter, GPH family